MTLRDLRKRIGMTQVELADALGVCNHTIYLWECGHYRISAVDLKKMCKMANVSMDEIELKEER